LSPFSHGFGGNQREKIHEGFMHTPPTNPEEKAPKITKKENRDELKQALRNHIESSIHTMKVHTRSSFRPIILPSHKISP
jgi:hypothetical protein